MLGLANERGAQHINIGLFACRPVSDLAGSQATYGGWLLAVVLGGLGPSVRRSGCGRTRRRVRRVVRVGVELPRHDG